MAGCTATAFCPTANLKRGATIRLLHDAFGVEPPPVDPPPADAPGAEARTSLSSGQGPMLAGLHLASVSYKAARATGVPTADQTTVSRTIRAHATGTFQRCVIVPTAPIDTG